MSNNDWTVRVGLNPQEALQELRKLSQAGKQAGRELGRDLDGGLNAVPVAAKKAADAVQATGQAVTKAGREYQTAANGLKFYIDAQGRARNEAGKFISAQEKVAAGIKEVGEEAKAAIPDVRGLLSELAGFITVGAAIAFAANEIRKFDAGAAAVRTLGVDATALSASLREVSESTGGAVSQVQLLTAAYDVASSGFSKAADATKILEAGTLASIGGFADLNTTLDAVTSVLNAYGLSVDQAEKLSDGFIQTQNDGKITVAQYATQIGNVASIAAAAGVSIEELNAAISAATAKGVPVEQTFTGLRQAISSILKPTSEATTLAKQLGLQFGAQALKAKGLGQFLAEVNEKTKGSVELNTILFSSVEAVAAVQPLLNDSLEAYNRFLGNQQNASGQARKAYEEIANTIDQATKRITGSLSNLAVQTQSAVAPAALAGLETLSGLLEFTSANLNTIIGVSAGIGTVVGILFTAGKATKLWAQATQALVTAKAVLVSLAGPKGLVLVAGALAAGVVVANTLSETLNSVEAAANGAAREAQELANQIERTKALIENQKKYNLDTTEAEKRLAELEKRLERINADTAKKSQRSELAKEIEEIEEQRKKLQDSLNKDTKFLGNAAIVAQVESLRQLKLVLESVSSGDKTELATVGEDAQEGVKRLQALQAELDKLVGTKATIPIDAEADRARIDREIADVKRKLEAEQLIVQAEIELDVIEAQLKRVQEGLRGDPNNVPFKKALEELLVLREEAVVKQRQANDARRNEAKTAADVTRIDERAVELARQRLQIVDQVNQLRREGALRDLDGEAAVASAALSFVQAVQGAESSRFDIIKARNEFQLNQFRALGFSEQQLAGLRRQSDQIEARQIEARFKALLETQRIEAILLALQQRRAKSAADLAVIAARESVIREQQALAEAEAAPAGPNKGREIAAAREQLALAQQRLGIQEEAVGLLRTTQPLEAAIAGLTREQALNSLQAQAARVGLEGNLVRLEQQFRENLQSLPALDIAGQFGSAVSEAERLARSIGSVRQQARGLVDELDQGVIFDIRPGRFTGGPVSPGQDYTVNEFGQEAFLSRSGQLSLINKPAWSAWRPPTAGTVIPAGVTADLKARGALSPGGGRSTDPAIAQLSAAVGNLSREVAQLRAKKWVVPVSVRNQAGTSQITAMNRLL